MHLDDLRPLELFDGLADKELLELIELGADVQFAPGEELFREGAPAEFWWVLVEGKVDLVRHVGREETVLGAMDVPGRWAGGFRAWDDNGVYLATGRAPSPAASSRCRRQSLKEWSSAWFPFGAHLIEGLFRTARNFEAMTRQREALVALGTLAAGLAHEINNPAAAATRAVDALGNAWECCCPPSAGSRKDRSPLTSSSRSTGFGARSSRRRSAQIPWPTRIARMPCRPGCPPRHREGLADSRTARAGRRRRRVVRTRSRGARRRCARAGTGMGREHPVGANAARRGEGVDPAHLRAVGAVKSYSQLDRASMQETDVAEGLESTLVMLAHRIPEGVTVVRDYGADVPRIEAAAGELNQVWTNLIDNAIDAMDGAGTLRVSTLADDEAVIVEIGDTGAGMTRDVQHHAFEPFFTTKGVGKGTGLGLDISRRIVVDRHSGEITIDAQPGETVLRVRLPRRPSESQLCG